MSNADVTNSGSFVFNDTSSLSTTLEDCWKQLARAVDDRKSGWRLPVLATFGEVASDVRQRIVVLRGVDIVSRVLFAHTDVRSPKVASIRRQHNVSMLFYDAHQMSQLQISGSATIHVTDRIADQFWDTEPESSLRGYLAPRSPGETCNAPEINLPKSVQGRVPERGELDSARQNFAVIAVSVTSIEWLLLASSGNLRARFAYSRDGSVDSEWVAP